MYISDLRKQTSLSLQFWIPLRKIRWDAPGKGDFIELMFLGYGLSLVPSFFGLVSIITADGVLLFRSFFNILRVILLLFHRSLVLCRQLSSDPNGRHGLRPRSSQRYPLLSSPYALHPSPYVLTVFLTQIFTLCIVSPTCAYEFSSQRARLHEGRRRRLLLQEVVACSHRIERVLFSRFSPSLLR
jgi:hypothetical protein